jgi:hypothetical protein
MLFVTYSSMSGHQQAGLFVLVHHPRERKVGLVRRIGEKRCRVISTDQWDRILELPLNQALASGQLQPFAL